MALYAELNDFLAAPHCGTEFIHSFQERVSVKDVIEALGVPYYDSMKRFVEEIFQSNRAVKTPG